LDASIFKSNGKLVQFDPTIRIAVSTNKLFPNQSVITHDQFIPIGEQNPNMDEPLIIPPIWLEPDSQLGQKPTQLDISPIRKTLNPIGKLIKSSSRREKDNIKQV